METASSGRTFGILAEGGGAGGVGGAGTAEGNFGAVALGAEDLGELGFEVVGAIEERELPSREW